MEHGTRSSTGLPAALRQRAAGDEDTSINYRAQVEVAKVEAEQTLSDGWYPSGNANDLVAYLEKINALPPRIRVPRPANPKPRRRS